MLQGYPTKNGTGIAIYGDNSDLTSLHSTVYQIASSLNESARLQAQSQLLMDFAYEVRKAFSGERLKDNLTVVESDQKMLCNGFNCVWTDVLIFISTLRHNAGYVQTNKLHQACLYMLEHVVEKAMFDYDPQGASVLQHYIGQRINITNRFAFIIYQALHIKFVIERSGKKRFRSIPQLIDGHFLEWKQEYKDLIHSFEVAAKG